MPDVGTRFELTVGPVAHGGHCVARLGDDPHGRVVFVRHALPGERVEVRITEDNGGGFCRADAVRVLTPSADRVAPPCRHAGPGRCGGCDWQHVTGPAQRALKAAVVREQLARLAGLDMPVEVEELPGGLLGWRTRTVYAVAETGELGLRRHRSHQVEPLEDCPLGAPGVGDTPVLRERRPGPSGAEVAVDLAGAVSTLEHRPARPRRGRGRRAPDRIELVDGPARLSYRVHGRDFTVAAGGFWQVHPAAAGTFADAVLEALRPRAGDRVLDLYAGAGLFTALLAEAVGPDGSVLGVESSAQAVADAVGNLADLPWAGVERGSVTPSLVAGLAGDADLVVLDPPRSGAGRDVMTAVLADRPRAVCYVACDPAALARDLAAAQAGGWRLAALRAFDAFPMTHHVECVATLLPCDGD